jgi:hypothetical protein
LKGATRHMDIIITYEEFRKMLKEYRRNPAKFIEECMNIRFLQYQREFINRIIEEEQYENLH